MEQARWRFLLLPGWALGVAGLLGAILIWASGASVVAAYGGLLVGMAGSWSALGETGVAATPYLFTGLAVALGLRGGLLNIGAEGQLSMGALSAAVVGAQDMGLPGWLHLPLAVAAGGLGGALWGAIPGALKARLGAHEVINTIMMNYIARQVVDYLVKQVLRDPIASVDRTATVLPSAVLPTLWDGTARLHVGLVVALGAVATVAWLLARTTVGFAIHTVGQNPSAAQYAGMPVPRTVVLTMTLSGLLAGLAGASEVLGLYHALPATFATDYGFEAIAVAFVARPYLWSLVPVALLWGGLRNGAGLMQVRSGVSSDLIQVLQALVLVCLAAAPLWPALGQRSLRSAPR